MAEPLAQIQVKNTLGEAWDKVSGFKGSFWAAIAIAAIAVGILFFAIAYGTGALIVTKMIDPKQISYFLITIPVLFIFIMFLDLCLAGLVYLGIQRAFDRPISYKQLFLCFKPRLMFNIIGVMLITQILLISINFLTQLPHYFQLPAIVGNISGIIGFIIQAILIIRLLLALPLTLDQAKNPLEAIRLSFKATRSNVLNIFLILLVWFFTGFLIIATLGIAAIWILPWQYITHGLVYRKLLPNIDR